MKQPFFDNKFHPFKRDREREEEKNANAIEKFQVKQLQLWKTIIAFVCKTHETVDHFVQSDSMEFAQRKMASAPTMC